MGSWFIATSYRCSASAGVMLPIGSRMRRLLNQSTHSRVAYSTASKDFHGPRLWITSALNRPLHAFGDRIVVAVTDTADRRLNPGLGQALRIANGDVLGASVRMMDQLARL